MTDIERLHDWDNFTEWEPTNNDLPPTEPHPNDYGFFWSMWVYPHPDMEGYTCSTGWVHKPYRRTPVDLLHRLGYK